MTDAPPIHQVLALVMEQVPAVPKRERNREQNYTFRGVDAVVSAVGPVLRRNGVVIVPHKVVAHYRDVRTAKDKPSRECTVQVTYRFYGPAGDTLDIEAPGESMDVSDKGTAKAMSVAYRIALLQALCLPTDEPDPDHEYPERAEEPEDTRSADDLRSEIMDLARANGATWEAIAQDFEARVKQPITEADPRYLRGYLGMLESRAKAKPEPVEGGDRDGS